MPLSYNCFPLRRVVCGVDHHIRTSICTISSQKYLRMLEGANRGVYKRRQKSKLECSPVARATYGGGGSRTCGGVKPFLMQSAIQTALHHE